MRTFRSLHHANYRLYFTGALVSNVGTWMSRVAQDWLVLTVLTDNSAVSLGIVTALQFLPMLLLAPYGGVLADQFSKRRLLACTQTAMAVLGLLLGVLTATGTVELWHVYVIATVFGMATAVDNPARQAFVSEMVPDEDIPNAVGLNSASFNFARLLGPGTAGILIAGVGIPPAFFLNTISFAAVLVALWRMDPATLRHSRRAARGSGALRDGLRYVRTKPDIMLILVIVFFFGTFCMNSQLTNALMATQVFHKGAGEYGLLGTIMAVGSLSAALLAARRKVPSRKVLIGSLVGFGFSSIAAGLAPNYTVFAILLIPFGLFALSMMTTANAIVQLAADPPMRGRVMALYMAVFMGGTPVGAPMIGWIGDTMGARATILAGAGVSLLVAAWATMSLMRTHQIPLSELHRRVLWWPRADAPASTGDEPPFTPSRTASVPVGTRPAAPATAEPYPAQEAPVSPGRPAQRR